MVDILKHKRSPPELVTILILTMMSFVVIQALGFIFIETMGHIKLGPAFILISVVMASGMSIAIFKKAFLRVEITKEDMFAFVIVSLFAIVMLFFLRDFVPEIFQPGLMSMQSMIGFP